SRGRLPEGRGHKTLSDRRPPLGIAEGREASSTRARKRTGKHPAPGPDRYDRPEPRRGLPIDESGQELCYSPRAAGTTSSPSASAFSRPSRSAMPVGSSASFGRSPHLSSTTSSEGAG